MMIKLVIFDVDGTLVDSESVYVKAAIKTCKLYGYNIPYSAILDTLGRNRVGSRKVIEDSQDASFNFDEYLSHLRQTRADMLEKEPYQLKKGALNILNYCKDKGIKMAIATSTYKEKQYKVLNDLKIIDYFDYMVFGDEIEKSKPEPDIYLNVYNHFNFDKKEILIFEDSANGILAASNAGINVVYIKDIVDVKEEIASLASKQVNDLDEGIKLLDEQ